MRELEALLRTRWILKSEDKELYYKIRDAAGEIRQFACEKMGCQYIENALLVKLEKLPVIPEPFMGIKDFTSKEEYAFLCVLLMYLEDKDDTRSQFILSDLTDYIALNMPGETVDWAIYTNRRRLIKVLRYAISQQMLKITDGDDESFMESSAGEVLYESTGASKYFVRGFSRNIMGFTKPSDFEGEEVGNTEDKGIARRHRVYKRLIFAPAMYQLDGKPEDFEYIKNQSRRLADELERMFNCNLQVYRGSAYLMVGDDSRMGTTFPADKGISDIVLLTLGQMQEKIKTGKWKTGLLEECYVSDLELEELITEVKYKFEAGFAKKFREMPDGEFVRAVLDELESQMFIRQEDGSGQIRIYPAVGKFVGRYPKDFDLKQGRAANKKNKGVRS